MLDSRQFRYRVKSRYLKAKRNLHVGYKGFVLTNKGEILGDLWWVENKNGVAGSIHPDLDWLRIQLGPEDVYLFDMYLMKEHRGGGTARLLMGGALRHLKEKGYKNAYGYYISHNIPALWTHRMLGYEELSRVEVKRRLARYCRLKEQQA
jgi:GNAT superfamily N-acetyltransferase